MSVEEVSGRTVEDAVDRALARLGVARDRVDVEVIREGKRGLLGFGGEDAIVRVTTKDDRATPGRGRRGGRGGRRGGQRGESAPREDRGGRRDDAPRGEDRADGRDEGPPREDRGGGRRGRRGGRGGRGRRRGGERGRERGGHRGRARPPAPRPGQGAQPQEPGAPD
ncbi:MAG: hypothetical protein F4X76_06990, partial [Chloroflexi bacterium]|nr:hypothetical protein [Chloroflexota bacterium]